MSAKGKGPELPRVGADARRSRERQPISPNMLLFAYRNYFLNILPLSYDRDKIKLVDYSVGVIVGFCIYNFGKRVGQFVKTIPDAQFLAQTREFQSGLGGLVVADCCPDIADADLLVDLHVLRAMDVRFIFRVLNPLAALSENCISHLASDFSNILIPQKSDLVGVSLSFISSKADQNGNRPEDYITGNVTPGEAALVDMLFLWAVFAQFASPKDLFFSRVSIGSNSDRKRFQQNVVNQVAKDLAVAFQLCPSGYSSNAFKVGGFTMKKREEEESSEPNSVTVQAALQAYFGHLSESASRHYQRNVLKFSGPLSSIWIDQAKDDAFDHGISAQMRIFGNGISSSIQSSNLSSSSASSSSIRLPSLFQK